MASSRCALSRLALLCGGCALAARVQFEGGTATAAARQAAGWKLSDLGIPLPKEYDPELPGLPGVKDLVPEINLPNCSHLFKFDEFLEGAKKLCDPKSVPKEKRVPKKLQGLFWLNGLGTDDITVCQSTAEWDKATRTMWLQKWKAFQIIDADFGHVITTAGVNFDWRYGLRFDEDLSKADLIPTAGPNATSIGKAYMKYYHDLTYMVMDEDPSSSTPGEKWLRRSGLAGMGRPTDVHYNTWQLIDGDLNINKRHAALFLEEERKRVGKKGIRVFHDC